MKLLPNHRLRYVLGSLGFAVLCYGGLHLSVRGGNDKLAVFADPDTSAADAVVVDPGSEYFFTWGVTASPRMKEIARTSVDNRYGDTYQQSYAVLTQLSIDLKEVGLTLRDVANVRAYIVADPEPDFAAWNKAFSEFFGTLANPHKPAMTSMGIARLFHSDYRVEVEFTAVFPNGRGPHVDGTRHHERYTRLSRTETSDRWRSYGRPAFPMSTGKATEGQTALFFSSSLRPEATMPNAPPAMQMFGDITKQSDSIFKQMGRQLKEAGLGYEDVFFIRACVYPGTQSIARSFAAFGKEYDKYFNNEKNPNRPTRTVMSTPGFNYKKQSISIEYYAAYPTDSQRRIETAREPIGATAAVMENKPIAAAGTAISAHAKLAFLSGSGSGPEGTFAEQTAAAFEQVKLKLASVGADPNDLVHLRAYIAEADPKTLDARIAAWESFFRSTFAEGSAPAITTLPVISLDGGGLIELEAMAAIR